jgi:hypothetical protein
MGCFASLAMTSNSQLSRLFESAICEHRARSYPPTQADLKQRTVCSDDKPEQS